MAERRVLIVDDHPLFRDALKASLSTTFAPDRIGDEWRGASFAVAQRVLRGDAVLIEAKVRIAALAASSFRPRPIPEPLQSELKNLLETL